MKYVEAELPSSIESNITGSLHWWEPRYRMLFPVGWGCIWKDCFSVSDTDWLCGDGWECTGQNNRHCVRLRRPKEQVLSTGTGLWHQNRFRIWIWGYCALLSTCRPPGQKAKQEKKKEKERQSHSGGCIPAYILSSKSWEDSPSISLLNVTPPPYLSIVISLVIQSFSHTNSLSCTNSSPAYVLTNLFNKGVMCSRLRHRQKKSIYHDLWFESSLQLIEVKFNLHYKVREAPLDFGWGARERSLGPL